MTKALTQFIYEKGHALFWALVAVSFSFAMLYAYFVNVSVLSVLDRQHTEQEISALEADVATIEARYLSAIEAITLERAHVLGFSEPKETLFASRKSLSRASVSFSSGGF